MHKTKTIFITSLIATISLLAISADPALAQMGMMMDFDNQEETEEVGESHVEPLEVVLQEILSEQKVNTIQELDCLSVSDQYLERLGDAVMEEQHPGESHEVMDRMMGGEGSESLEQMHINMGSAYLNCDDNGNYGMMDLGNGMYNREGRLPMMMGYGSGIISNLTWLSLNAFLLAGAYYFIKKANRVGKKKAKRKSN